MNDELKESVFNLIKDLDNLSDVKKVLRVNDIRGETAEIFIAQWSGVPKPEPIYPAKKLIVENKAIEEAPVVKDIEPEILVVDEPDIIADEPEVILEAEPEVEEIEEVFTPPPRFVS